MKALKDIRKGNIANFYLFYGEEKYKLRVYKDELKRNVPYDNEMNYSYYEGKDIDIQAVFDSVMTLPFFAEKRLVIVENSGLFKGKKKTPKGSEEEESEEDESRDAKGTFIERMITEAPDTTCLAFIEDSVLKTRKIYKSIQKKGVVEECLPDTASDVKKWIAKGVASYGMKIDPDAASLLIDRAGTDYNTLLHEVEKLTSYAAGRERITREDVLSVSVHNIESRIFDILTAMSRKDTSSAMTKYYDMLANREEPAMIMAMIRRQFRIMLQTAELMNEGRNDKEIAQITGNRDFVIKKMRDNLRYFKISEITDILDEINRLDMQTKTGQLDGHIAVEMLLLSSGKT